MKIKRDEYLKELLTFSLLLFTSVAWAKGIFPGLSGFPQEVQQDETPAAKPVVEENVSFPIFIGIP